MLIFLFHKKIQVIANSQRNLNKTNMKKYVLFTEVNISAPKMYTVLSRYRKALRFHHVWNTFSFYSYGRCFKVFIFIFEDYFLVLSPSPIKLLLFRSLFSFSGCSSNVEASKLSEIWNYSGDVVIVTLTFVSIVFG